MDDEDEELLDAPLRSMSCSNKCWVSSTLLITQVLEEMEALFSWKQDIESISSWDLVKQLIYDMQGLSTLACKTFGVLELFKSKDRTLQWGRDEV